MCTENGNKASFDKMFEKLMYAVGEWQRSLGKTTKNQNSKAETNFRAGTQLQIANYLPVTALPLLRLLANLHQFESGVSRLFEAGLLTVCI